MATANLKDIKRRIKSVESTMQITKAMELVASSKLRRAKEKAERAEPFFNMLYQMMCQIVAESGDFQSTFLQHHTGGAVIHSWCRSALQPECRPFRTGSRSVLQYPAPCIR